MPVAAAREQTWPRSCRGRLSGVIGAAYVAGAGRAARLSSRSTSAAPAPTSRSSRTDARATARSEHVGGVPVMMPVVGVTAIGAGGGSVAWVDDVGIPKVGPAEQRRPPRPGLLWPRRQGRDAHRRVPGLRLPRPGATSWAAACRCDRELAEEAVAPLRGARSGPRRDEAAESIVRVAVSNMYAEFTKILSRAARRPARLRPGGLRRRRPGGRRLSPARSASRTVFVPRVAGHAVRAGGHQRGRRQRRRAHRARAAWTGRPRPRLLRGAYEALRGGAGGLAGARTAPTRPAAFRHAADMRYVGQSYEIEVPRRSRLAGRRRRRRPLLARLPPGARAACTATPIARRRRRS